MEQFVRIDPAYYRRTEVEYLHAAPIRAKQQLGWEPEVTFQELMCGMVERDLRLQAGLDFGAAPREGRDDGWRRWRVSETESD